MLKLVLRGLFFPDAAGEDIGIELGDQGLEWSSVPEGVVRAKSAPNGSGIDQNLECLRATAGQETLLHIAFAAAQAESSPKSPNHPAAFIESAIDTMGPGSLLCQDSEGRTLLHLTSRVGGE